MAVGKKIIVFILAYIVLPAFLVYASYWAYVQWYDFQADRHQAAYDKATSEWSEENEAGYAKMLWDFYARFEELNQQERMDAYKLLVEYACVKELGCPVPQVVYSDLDEGVSGQYGHDLICLDYSRFQNPEVDVRDKIRTILHETRHAAQGHIVESFRKLESVDGQLYKMLRLQEGFDEISAWETDMLNYDDLMIDYATYYESRVETDARDFAEKIERKLWAEYELYYSWQGEEIVMRNAENASFYHAYAAKDDVGLLWITALVSFVIGFLVFARTANRRLSVGFVLGFMALFCYRTIFVESQMFAMTHGFSGYGYWQHLLLCTVWYCLMFSFVIGIVSKDRSALLENLQLIASILLLVLRAYTSIWYIAFCVVWLFLLFYPVKKKKKAAYKRYPVHSRKLRKVS